MSKNKPLLEIKNLSISFMQYVGYFKKDKVKTIDNISLTLNRGEIVAIIGASGSGKSLVAHSIMGILPNNAIETGTIKYDGELLTQELKTKLRKNTIALIPQSVNYLDPLMKVGKQVSSLIDKKDAQKKQQETFSRYKLAKEVADFYPFELSGGMARRVLISTAVVKNAQLIIADEPTPGLSPDLITETLTNLKQLANKGCGILLITHDINAALKIANKIVVFFDGVSSLPLSVDLFKDKGEEIKDKYIKKLWQSLPQNNFFEKEKIYLNAKKTRENSPNLQKNQLSGQNLNFFYDKSKPLLNNFNFSLFSDEIVGLIGASGSGKSSLAQILAGYLKPQKGEVLLNSKPIKNTLNPIQLIYQHPEQAVNPRWKLKKTLTEAFAINADILKALDIKEAWLNRYAHELSGGELQRFCIARVLNPQTKFLIADEMTTMLDAITQAKVWELILDWTKKHNVGLLIISHEKPILAKLCDRFISIDKS